MIITFERVYNGAIDTYNPPVPDAVRAGAEQQVQWLLTTREHMLYTQNGREFRRGQAWGTEYWRVTFTPEQEQNP